jgi:hypothetical protein
LEVNILEKAEKIPRSHDRRGRFLPSLVPASDEKGFGVTLTCRCAPDIMRIVSELTSEAIAKGTFPWRTKGDVIRWLITAGIDQVRKEREIDGPYLAMHELERVVDAEAGAAKEAKAMRDRIIGVVNTYITIKAHDRAVEFLQSAVQKAHKLENQVWADWLVDELALTFPALVRQSTRRTVSMVPRTLRLQQILPPGALDDEEDEQFTQQKKRKKKTLHRMRIQFKKRKKGVKHR